MEDWLARSAREVPDRLALRTREGAVTYRELDAAADRAARRLAALGVGEGDLVATTLPAGRELCELVHAAPRAGAALVPLNTRLREAERRRQLEELRPRLLVEAPLDGDEADAALRLEHAPEAVHSVVFTSGSTAQPKPVALTHGNHLASARAAASILPLGPRDRWLCVLPLFHVGGLAILLRCAMAGAAVELEPGFDAPRCARALTAGEVTVVSLVPTMLRRLRVEGLERAPGLRAALLGGGPIPGDLLDWAAGHGIPAMPTYGMTETASQVATGAPGARTARPLEGVELRISADGEILVRGPMVAPGAAGPDGWLRTGDRGRLAPGGDLVVEGRIKDVIVTGGENVAAAEVEEALLAHPAVADAGVAARPDPEWGEIVVAHVVLSAPASDGELREHCRARLAAYKVPKAFARHPELPRNATGKLLRGLLEPRARGGGGERARG